MESRVSSESESTQSEAASVSIYRKAMAPHLKDINYTHIFHNIPLQVHPGGRLIKYISRDEDDEGPLPRCNCREYCGDGCPNRRAKIQCLPQICRMGTKDCLNRRVIHGPKQCLDVIDAGNSKGYGLISTQPISKGQFIIQYIGEVLNLETREGRQRYQSNMSNCYFYMMRKEKQHFIDAYRYGNQARFINHSCNPNCIVFKWTVGEEDKLCIFAQKNIPAYEQLTYNYDFNSWPENLECQCGSFNCITVKKRRMLLKKTEEEYERSIGKEKETMDSWRDRDSDSQESFRSQEIQEIMEEERIELPFKAEINIPALFINIVKAKISISQSLFVQFPQVRTIQSVHERKNVRVQADSEEILTHLYREVQDIISELESKSVEIDKQHFNFLEPVIQQLNRNLQGKASIFLGCQRTQYKEVNDVRIVLVRVQVVMVASKERIQQLYNSISNEISQYRSEYIVVDDTSQGQFYTNLSLVPRSRVSINREDESHRQIIYSVKGRLLDVLEALEMLGWRTMDKWQQIEKSSGKISKQASTVRNSEETVNQE